METKTKGGIFDVLNHLKQITMNIKTEKKDNQGRENKTMYWLIVTNNKGTETVLNVGQKTYEGVQKMIEEEAGVQELPLKTPQNEVDKNNKKG